MPAEADIVIFMTEEVSVDTGAHPRTHARWLNGFTDCLAAYGRHLAAAFGGRVEERDGVVMCDPRLAWRLRNMVVALEPLAEVTARDLPAHLVGFYGSRHSHVLWSTKRLSLDAEEFRLAASSPVMVRTTATAAARKVEGLSIVEVTDDDGVRLAEQLRLEGDTVPPPYDPTRGRFFDARVLGDGHRLWIGYLDGLAVATASAFVHGDLNMVKNVSTSATYRGLGIGSAMSEHAISSSTHPAILDSSEVGEPVYRRLGFTTAGQVDFW